MSHDPISGRIPAEMSGPNRQLSSCLGLFFLILAGYLIAWPIVMYDTDLWYHLSGGRYFWQHMTPVQDAFFSYIDPPKSWYNYYWLFQAVIYRLYAWTGYYGLIGLRCLAYCLTALFIALFFIRRCANATERLTGLFWFVSCTAVILNRELLVRPHLFSYLLIVVFLYILEYRRDRIWLLPPLGILWANLHGIEYPVMFVIVFAYLAEIFWNEFRKIPPGGRAGKREKWLLIAVFYTIFLTPGMIRLVQIPFSVGFQNAAYQHLYVNELLHIPFRDLFIFAPVTLKGVIAALQNLIILFAAASFLLGLWQRRLRISHAILFAGALILLTRHLRFLYEFTLLSLPLLRQGAQQISQRLSLPRRLIAFALPATVVLAPFLIFQATFAHRPAYPFSEANLPAGVVRFLNHHAPGGRILNEPNTGGYLPWALNPGFKIYMDMQMTIFSDADFATAHNALSDPNVFAAFIRRYDPSFISVSLHRSDFRKVVATDARFVPVFFDHAELLFVNKDHSPDMADKYALQAIDPFRFREIKYDALDAGTLSRMAAEATRIVTEDPTNFSARQILSGIAVARREYGQALFHADGIIRDYPEQSHGYALKADALFAMERYAEAARLYRRAMAMGQTAKPENVYWNLHAAYVKLKEYGKAYRLLSRYVNPFTPATDYREIYQLGMSAAAVGKTPEAVLFLKIARMKTPATDAEYLGKIDRNLALLDGPPR